MKMRIRNKILIAICFLILLSLVGQIVFNQFLSKSFFVRQQKSMIAESYEQIKTGYGDDLDAVNDIAENLQDTYGIRISFSAAIPCFKAPAAEQTSPPAIGMISKNP